VTGFPTLLYKEVLRFWKVAFQTVAAPVLTALLYVLIFANVLDQRVEVYPGVPYAMFLIPGLAMMSALQNAFANASSSLIQSKMTGNVVFILLAPFSNLEFLGAYVVAAMLRGIVVGAGVLLVALPFWLPTIREPLWLLVFLVIGTGTFGAFGLIAAIVVDKIDQMAAFQNFVIMPLTFLSGVFFSTHSLSDFWQRVSHLNPVFYIIDGFRYGFFGISDVHPAASLAVGFSCFSAIFALAYALIARGYKLRA